jgi:hypothetical protein
LNSNPARKGSISDSIGATDQISRCNIASCKDKFYIETIILKLGHLLFFVCFFHFPPADGSSLLFSGEVFINNGGFDNPLYYEKVVY